MGLNRKSPRRLPVRKCFLLLPLIAGFAPSARGQEPAMPDSVRRYVSAALDTLQRVSLHRDSVDWRALRDSVFIRAGDAQTTDGTWRALQWALRRVDPHSFLQTPRPMPARTQAPGVPAAPPSPAPVPAKLPEPEISGRLVDRRYGYISVPSFAGTNRPTFVDSLQSFIRDFDQQRACGWLIDLRLDHGGNMWPMLAGIGPLLGAEVVGSFVGTGEGDAPWRYRDGHAWSGGSEMPTWGGAGSLPPYRVRDSVAPVALLIGGGTASSGEATLLAFLGRPNVRTFGDTTAGFNSVNNNYSLPDGAVMLVTVGYSRDRLGRGYALKVAPDEAFPSGGQPGVDAPLLRAQEWLATQRACRAPH